MRQTAASGLPADVLRSPPTKGRPQRPQFLQLLGRSVNSGKPRGRRLVAAVADGGRGRRLKPAAQSEAQEPEAEQQKLAAAVRGLRGDPF